MKIKLLFNTAFFKAKNKTQNRTQHFLKVMMLLLVGFLGIQGAKGQVTIASQNFEASLPPTNWIYSESTSAGTANPASTVTTTASQRPASTAMFMGARAYNFAGTSGASSSILTFNSIDTSTYTSLSLSMRIAAWAASSTQGIEATNDSVLIEVSTDNGTTWYRQAQVTAVFGTDGGNATWAFSGTGSGSRAYLANNILNTFSSGSVSGGTTNPVTYTGTNAITSATITSLPSTTNLRLRITLSLNGSANENWTIDDVIITGTSVCAAPTTQASAITFPSVGTNTMNVNWTNGDGAGRVVIMNTTNTFTTPTTGSNPTASTIYGSGQQVIFNGTGSGSVAVTGLTPGTTYHYRVYEYCSPDRNYQSATATNNPLSQATNATPTITTTPTALNTFVYIGGAGPSSEQTFTVAGANLTANLLLTAPTGYEISTSSGGTFSGTLNLIPTSGTIASTTIFVRLQSGLAIASYTGNITAASTGATTQNIACTGEVINALLYDGFNDTNSLFTLTGGGFFNGNTDSINDLPLNSPLVVEGSNARGVSSGTAILTTTNGISTLGYTNVQLSLRLATFGSAPGEGADASDTVTVEVSPDDGATWFSTLLVTGNQDAYWPYSASGVASTADDGNPTTTFFTSAPANNTTTGFGTVTISNLPATDKLKVRITLLNNATTERWVVDDFRLTGTLTATPTRNVSATLNNFTSIGTAASSGQSFTVSGSSLSSAISIAASTNYEISTTSNFASTVSPIILPHTAGNLATTTIYVRLKAGLGIGTYNGENIEITGGGVVGTTNVTCNGEVIDVIAFEGFNNSSSLFAITAGSPGPTPGAYFSGQTGSTAGPANSPYAFEGSHGYGLASAGAGTTVLTSNANAINTAAYTGVALSVKLAALSTVSTGGLENSAADTVKIDISPDGGTNYYPSLVLTGNSNAHWAYGASGSVSEIYDGNVTAPSTDVAPNSGFNAAGYSTLTITGLPRVTDLRVRITLGNDSTSEIWVIDDFRVTGTLDIAAPTVTTLSPLDDASGVAINSNLLVTFNENIVKGTGNILIKRVSGDATVQTIAVGSTDVTIANNIVTINPADLLNNVAYYVEIPAGVFEDLAGNDYAGISGNAGWNFTTEVTNVTDYFRTRAGGEWSLATNWESSSDNSTWITASLAPTSAANTITINTSDIMFITNGTVTADNLVINTNGLLAIAGGTFILNNGTAATDLQVNGTLAYNSGTLTTAGSGIVFGAGGLYNHSIAAATLTLPIATWDATSTCNVRGMNNTGAITAGATIGQTFGNFIWNNMNQGNFVNIANDSFAVAGTLTVGSQANNRLSFANAVGTFTNSIGAIVVSGGLLNCVGASANVTVNVANSVTVSGGTMNVSGGSGTATLNIEGNLTVSGGKLDLKTGTNSAGTLNLKGNLDVASGAILLSDVSGSGTLNFTGTTLQTISVANATTSQGINFNVTSGASAQLINQDLALGTNAAFRVLSGGTFDFGFNGTTALNVVPVTSQTQQIFEYASGSILKITSPLGITRTTAGNIQIPLTGRITNSGATLQYIGKANQVAGNLLISPLTGKVIVEMDTDALTFSASDNETFNTGGIFEIRKGIVVDNSTNSFGQASSNSALLTMSDGRYRISKTGTQPSFTGASITGGVIEFASSQATPETIRNLSYQNIEVTGNNVGNSTGNITLEDGGTFTVKSGGIFSINDNSIIGPTGTQTVTVENGGVFKTGDPQGFNGANTTSIRNNIENISLAVGSRVEFAGNQSTPATQTITPFSGYSDVGISGKGKKILPTTEVYVGRDLLLFPETIAADTGFLEIDSDQLLTVERNIINNSTKELVIKDSGNLVQLADVLNTATTNIGNIKMTRNSAKASEGYTYWGSPVKEGVAGQVPAGFDRSYNWVTNGAKEGVWSLLSSTAPGVGFISRTNDSTPGTQNFDFVGTPNNGTVTVTATATADPSTADSGNFILLANPYPSALNATALVAANSGVLGGTFYFWTSSTPETNGAYTVDDYATWNLTGSTVVTGGATPAPTGMIAAGQGFFADVKASGAINFTNAMRRRTLNENNQFFRIKATKNDAIEKSRVWLNLTNDKGAFRQMLVGYVTDADNGYDSRFDGESFTYNEIDLYSIVADKNLVIQGRALPFEETDTVPLGVYITNAGSYSIAIDKADGLLTNLPVFVEDKVAGVVHNLKDSAYTFATTAGSFNDRFVLRYTDNTLATQKPEAIDNSVLVAVKNKQIEISANENINTITVYDFLGRQLLQKEKVGSSTYLVANLVSKQEVILVKVLLKNGKEQTTKVVF